MKMRVVWLLGVMGVTACSSALVVPESKFGQAEEIHCEHVTPTGSHRSRRVCTTRAERDANAAEAKSELEKAMEYQRGQEMRGRVDPRVPARP